MFARKSKSPYNMFRVKSFFTDTVKTHVIHKKEIKL